MGKKEKKQKPVAVASTEPKPARKPRAKVDPITKMRKLVSRLGKAHDAALKLANAWGGGELAMHIASARHAHAMLHVDNLAENGFVPPATTRGRAKYVPAVGDRVYLKPAALKRFRHMSAHALANLYVSALDEIDPAWVRVTVDSDGAVVDHLGPVKIAHLTNQAPVEPTAETSEPALEAAE